MARVQRKVSQEFLEYQRVIVSHPNYDSLPNKVNEQGLITWVKQGDVARASWWDNQKSILGFEDRASVARHIHPAELEGMKPCQVCGNKMSVHPVYPSLAALKKINLMFISPKFEHFKADISTIALESERLLGANGLKSLAKIFGLPVSEKSSGELVSEIVKNGRFLSPGVMSNAPDRLDGFHSYNACCRSTQDTGRHASNLARYSSDRRAYENWAEGDWRGADRLMGIYKKETRKVPCPKCGKIRKMSPDHVGPISLGFMHRMSFQPMCGECNSAKNNRLTAKDVETLISQENQGDPVISWHSKPIWDSLKPLITDDQSAVRASVLMRRNMHHVLILLSILQESGFEAFLGSFLHPEFSAFDFDFENFDPLSGDFDVVRHSVDSVNTRKLAARYMRVSFESLANYAEVENRKNQIWQNVDCDRILENIKLDLAYSREDFAREKIATFLNILAREASIDFYR